MVYKTKGISVKSGSATSVVQMTGEKTGKIQYSTTIPVLIAESVGLKRGDEITWIRYQEEAVTSKVYHVEYKTGKQQYSTTIPRSAVAQFNIKKGDIITWIVENGKLKIDLGKSRVIRQ